MSKKKAVRHFFPFWQVLILISSGLLAWWFAHSSHGQILINLILPFEMIAAIIAGVLYASYFTAPLAVIVFLALAHHTNPIQIAVLGGFGGMLADLVILSLLRSIFGIGSKRSRDHSWLGSVMGLFHKLHLDIIMVVLGVVFVMAPLPDELGLLFLGVSKLSTLKATALTFVLNAVGIFALVYAALTLS